MSAVLTLFAGIVCFVYPVFAKDWEVTINVPYPDRTFEIQVDGKVMPIIKDGDKYKVTVQDESQFITAIQYYQGSEPVEIYDSSGNRTTDTAPYPEHMAVWEINKYYEADPEDDNKVKLKNLTVPEDRLEGFDDILGYEGFALKPPEKRIQPNNELDMTDGGLRVSLSMPKSIKQNGLMEGEDQRYSIKEYGLLHIFSRNWNAQSKDHMTIGEELVEKSASYRAGSFDNELTAKSTDTKSVFSNYLYNVVDFDTNKYFRAYVKIHRNATNEDLYLYGPIVGRNPYYVAKSYESTIASNPNKYNDDMKAYVRHVVSAVEGTGGSSTPTTGDEEINIFFIGDSIMMGQTLRSGSTTQNKPQDYTQVSKPPSVLIGNAISGRLNAYHTKQGDGKKTKVNCTLIANGGTTYSEPGINRVNMPMLANRAKTQGVTPNYIFLLAGVNDWAYADQGEGDSRHSAWFGGHENGRVKNEFGHDYEPGDGRSYAIGFDTTIKTLLNEYEDDHTKIIVISPLRAFWKPSGPGTTTVNASTGKTLSEYSYLQYRVSKYYNDNGKDVYFIDLYELMCEPMGLPRTENSVPEDCANFWKYFPDGIHPNQSGYNKAFQALLNAMRNTTDHDGKKLIPDADGNW